MSESIKKETKQCQYCAEKILQEATICRFCNHIQVSPTRSKKFWIFVWLPTIILIVLGFFLGSLWPVIVGIFYWSALAYQKTK